MNGGTSIIGYEIQVDDGNNGEFKTVIGGEGQRTLATSVTVTAASDGIRKGYTYRAQYRAVNSIGSSAFSPIGYLLAAAKPEAPPAPSLTSASNTQIVLGLTDTSDDGGSTVISYSLYMNEGTDGSDYNLISTGTATTATITVGDIYGTHTVAVSKKYTFKYVATNAIDSSEDSDLLTVYMARAPNTPVAPTFSFSNGS